jgi:hypothetical protein
MGEVWKARDSRVDRTVAIKFAQAGFTERFERESRAIAALNHPNVCHLYDVGSGYLVMEYVDGEPLRAPGDWRTLLDMAAAIAGGLAEAHAAGIVHRDLKPDNVMVRRDGTIKILDFGVAKRAEDNVLETRTTPVTAVGSVVGTVAYMSPEQATGREVDFRSDQFSFGLILYELASGKRAFDRPSSAETMAALIRDEPEPLPAGVPRPLAWIIDRCLAKDPAFRYDSTRDLYRELSTVRQHLTEITREVPVLAASRVARRPWLRESLLALAGLAIGAVAALLFQRAHPLRDTSWSGVRLGGAAVSINPRPSPDGHLLAFVAMVNGVTELAVMEPGSESWTLLTHGGREGQVQNVSWSSDGSRLYFDRYWGQPAGVYTIPPLGGTPVLLLERAFEPQTLPDGSLLVVRLSGASDQIFRFWPQNGKLQALPAFFDVSDVAVPFRPYHDGRELAYIGRTTADASEPKALRVLNLDTGAQRVLEPQAQIDLRSLLSEPLAVTHDGAAVIMLARRGDTYDLIEVRTDGTPGHRVVMTLRSTELPLFVDVGGDGSLYLDQVGRPRSILYLSARGDTLRELSTPVLDGAPALALPDGRTAVATSGAKARVLIGTATGEFRPFLQTDEPTTGPLAVAGRDAIAFVIGLEKHQRIAIASITDGHILREIPLAAGAPSGIAVSPDRSIVYYAQNSGIYALAGTSPARRLGEGDTLTLDPSGRYLYAKQFGKDPIRLVRIDTVSGEQTTVPVPSEPRLTPVVLSSTAVDANERMLVETSSPLNWFYRAALLDLRTGTMTPIRTAHVGDCVSPGWGADASILCNAVGLTGSLWRYVKGTPQ